MKRFLAVVLILAGIGYVIARVAPDDTQTASATAPSGRAALPGDAVRIKSQNWHKGGFDTVGLVNLTIENGNPYPVKDVQLACRYYAPSGALLTVHTPVVYEKIPAKGRKVIRGLNVGFIHPQADRGGCSIVSANLD